MQNGQIKYFSMFTGVGGFELGIKKAGRCGQEENLSKSRSGNSSCKSNKRQYTFSCIGFSEIDKYTNQLLANKFPEVKNYGDATKIIPSELPDFDMLCGGFPCQSFSIAGKRRGFNDTRGTMFFHIARILEVKRPKIVFLENVKGLLNHDKGETFRVIIQTLSELGYDVQWMVLNSKFFGVPQNRERVFIIGSLRGEPRPEILPFNRINTEIDEQNKEARQIIQVDDVARENKHKLGDRLKMDGTSFTLNSIEQRGIIENPETLMDINQAQRVYSTDGTSITLKGLGGGQGAKTGLYDVTSVAIRNKNRALHQNKEGMKYGDFPKDYQIEENKEGISYTVKGATKEFMCKQGIKIRRLTPKECERLQGFPDGWTEGFSDTQRYKMMGNAVTVNVIKAIANRLWCSFENEGVKR